MKQDYTEFEEVMDRVPSILSSSEKEKRFRQGERNALVLKDEFGRIGILLDGMVWLGADIKNFKADQAPFCG